MIYDLIGALISLLSTYYYIRLDIKAWPIGLLATCINGYLYWQKGIYADMCLESFYFLSICYGWYRWSTFQQKKITTLTYLSAKQWLYLSLGVGTLYIVIYNVLVLSHSTVAKLDALTTSLSLAAQWLMCYKVIATWALWFMVDALYALMYLTKELPFHTSLMLLYTGLAIFGYIQWYKKYPPMNPSSLNPNSADESSGQARLIEPF